MTIARPLTVEPVDQRNAPSPAADSIAGAAWLPVAEAAKIVGVAQRTAYRWVASGRVGSRNGSRGVEVEVGTLRALATPGRSDSSGLPITDSGRANGSDGNPARATRTTATANGRAVEDGSSGDDRSLAVEGLAALKQAVSSEHQLVEALKNRLERLEAQLAALQQPSQPCPSCQKVALALTVRCQECGDRASITSR